MKKTAYIVKSRTASKYNCSRCWFNIRYERLQEAANNNAMYYIECEIDGKKKTFCEDAQMLLNYFNEASIPIMQNPLRYSFYVNHENGEIYKTVSKYNDIVIVKLQQTSSPPDSDISDINFGCEPEAYWEKNGVEAIDSSKLHNKAKETYNYHHLAAVLAEYGFESHRIHNDANGADLVAYNYHPIVSDNKNVLKTSSLLIQLKSRVVIAEKYRNKGIIMAFPQNEDLKEWYLVPHDDLFSMMETQRKTNTFINRKEYSTNYISKKLQELLKPYIIKSRNIRD